MKKCLLVGFSLLLALAFALPSHAYQAFRLDGNGYASIADASAAGLDMGLSDFMIEARIKSSNANSGNWQMFLSKGASGVTPGYYFAFRSNNDALFFNINDGSNVVNCTGSTTLLDGRWHSVVAVVDRSGNAQLYVGGSTSGSATSLASVTGSIDGLSAFTVGSYSGGTNKFTGLSEEVRVWNFGKNGLPADYEAYITWRAQGRNVFLDISEYNSGSWNCYADADRTEKITDPGIENWTGDTPDNWTESGESGGVRDILDENGTGGGNFHGGSHAAKFEATNAGGTGFQVTGNVTLVANKYYELLGWIYYPTRTAGAVDALLWNATDGILAQITLAGTNAAYAEYSVVGKPTVVTSILYLRMTNETTTGIAYFDDISVKQTGLVGHWKFEGDYLDQGSNNNDLTAGGTGNAFPGYTLKKQKILSPFSIK